LVDIVLAEPLEGRRVAVQEHGAASPELVEVGGGACGLSRRSQVGLELLVRNHDPAPSLRRR
jgi:hypothetical protein